MWKAQKKLFVELWMECLMIMMIMIMMMEMTIMIMIGLSEKCELIHATFHQLVSPPQPRIDSNQLESIRIEWRERVTRKVIKQNF